MIEQYLLKKALDASFERAKKLLRESGRKLLATRDDIEESINYHLQSVQNWAKEVSFSDLKKAKRTSEIFIDLDLFVHPRRYSFSESIDTIHIKEIFESSDNHFIILGQPGAGKTTSMKYLCHCLFYEPEFYADRFAFPVLIRLRDLNRTEPLPESAIILDQLLNIFGLRIDFTDLTDFTEEIDETMRGLDAKERRFIKERLAISFLDDLQVLLILDGFDELSLARDRDDAVDEIRKLAYQLNKSTLIVTSRTGDFVYSIENAVPYELCPLTKEQIETFAMKWLKSSEKTSDFLTKIYESPFADTAIRPLTLAHLSAIYEREGRIPDKPKTIYRKIINLLLEEWDQQRSVKRYSKYGKFEVDRKFEFLCHLAYMLTTWLEKTVFSKDDLRQIYGKIHTDYGLDRNQAQQVVNEIESHTGLLIQSGYEAFEFAHKSLQEYLTAEYLVRLPSIPLDITRLSKIPSELAVAVTISSRPSLYLSELVGNRFLWQPISEDFLKAFLSRLFLEKPDFTPNNAFFLAVITLYSLYADLVKVRDSELKRFCTERNIVELERLANSASTSSTLNIVNALYQTEQIYATEDGDVIHQMIQKQLAKPPEHLTLPGTIYLRDRWLKKN